MKGKRIYRQIVMGLVTGIMFLSGTSLEAQSLLTIDRSMDIAVENSPDILIIIRRPV